MSALLRAFSSSIIEHESEYLRAVKDVSDHDLASFDSSALETVRVGEIAYGYHLFDKVKLPLLTTAISISAFLSRPRTVPTGAT